MMAGAVFGLRCLVLVGLSAGVLLAQRAPKNPDEDPFTRGVAERMAAVGIEAYAPMPWAGDHTTIDIVTELGNKPPIRWAETRHFKIGIGLAERPWPKDKRLRRELNAEVDAWWKKFPRTRGVRVKKPKKVTSWLLVHLYAQRLEELYADFCRRSGYADEAPEPGDHGHDGQGWRDRGGIGKGPFLGQHGKFCLLVLERRSDLARYMGRWANRRIDQGSSHYFEESSSLLYIATPDTTNGALRPERALHCNIVYGMVRNFIMGLQGFSYDLPAWHLDGLAHWYRRKLDEQFNSLRNLPESQWSLLENADWGAKVRGRVQTGAFPAATDLVRWQEADIDTVNKHVMAWARIDFLLAQGDEKFANYLAILKGLPTTGVPREQILQAQDEALAEVYGFDAAGFDEAWVAWVRANYKRK